MLLRHVFLLSFYDTSTFDTAFYYIKLWLSVILQTARCRCVRTVYGTWFSHCLLRLSNNCNAVLLYLLWCYYNAFIALLYSDYLKPGMVSFSLFFRPCLPRSIYYIRPIFPAHFPGFSRLFPLVTLLLFLTRSL